MVLIINKKTYSDKCTLDDLADHESLIKLSKEFARSDEIIQPNEEISQTIYVTQREFAVLNSTDRHQFRYLGSDDATTCHIIVIDNQAAVALAHLDGGQTRLTLDNILQELDRYAPSTVQYDVYLCGGFLDGSSKQYSRKLSNEILHILSTYRTKTFHLKLSAITDFNDQIRNQIHYPLIYGICFDIQTRTLRKMNFQDFGPAFRLRSIYQSIDDHPAWCIYSSIEGNIQIPKFSIPRHYIDHYYLRLYQSYFHNDKLLLTKTSTSPEQERPTYIKNMKRNILFILKYWQSIPTWFDSKTNSISYQRIDNQWQTDNKNLIDDIEID